MRPSELSVSIFHSPTTGRSQGTHREICQNEERNVVNPPTAAVGNGQWLNRRHCDLRCHNVLSIVQVKPQPRTAINVLKLKVMLSKGPRGLQIQFQNLFLKIDSTVKIKSAPSCPISSSYAVAQLKFFDVPNYYLSLTHAAQPLSIGILIHCIMGSILLQAKLSRRFSDCTFSW